MTGGYQAAPLAKSKSKDKGAGHTQLEELGSDLHIDFGLSAPGSKIKIEYVLVE